VIDRSHVHGWVEEYERVWRTAGTDQVAALFTDDATYRMSPFQEEPYRGVTAIGRLWEAERSGPDEAFTMTFDVVAVEDPRAVIRVEVRYGPPLHEHWRDLWIVEFDTDGRCRSFEEWPFSPDWPLPKPES
jgi:SnoaL-like protein